MNGQKLRHLREGETTVYRCTFELHLQQLVISVRFPCRFFIEWKTSNGKQSVKTQGLVESQQGRVLFNRELLLQTEMIYDGGRNQWVGKSSSISVYLVTRSRPDFNQLVGRINIDLAMVCERNPYKKVSTQALTHASIAADLRFSLEMKYSLQTSTSLSQMDLLEYSDRLYVVREEGQIGKSKSVGCLKVGGQNSHVGMSRFNSVSRMDVPKERQVRFGRMGLDTLVSEVNESVDLEERKSNHQSEFNIRMSLGTTKKCLSKQDYEQLIMEQTKGVKKSDLMFVPDMKRTSKVEYDDSEFHTERVKDEGLGEDHVQEEMKGVLMMKSATSKKQTLMRMRSIQSDVDINMIDMEGSLYETQEINNVNKINGVISPMDSNNSFSVSRFRAQFQGQPNVMMLKSPKQSIMSLNAEPNLVESVVEMNGTGKLRIGEDMQAYIRQLENRLEEVYGALEQEVEISKAYKEQYTLLNDRLTKISEENTFLLKKNKQLAEKFEFESKINQINLERLKVLNSQKSGANIPSQSMIATEADKVKMQLDNMRAMLKKAQKQNHSLKHKLQLRDEIELQNEIKIQQLQELLAAEKQRNEQLKSKMSQNGSSSLAGNQVNTWSIANQIKKQQNFKSHKKEIDIFQEKIVLMQKQNLRLTIMIKEVSQRFKSKQEQMKREITIIEKQFTSLVGYVLQGQRKLQQKSAQVEEWKKKYSGSIISTSTQNMIKQKQWQQKISSLQSKVRSYEGHIEDLQSELGKLESHNVQLAESYNKLTRESYRFEGDLRVIKEEESMRESLVSSGEGFRLSGMHMMNVRQENIINSYKQKIERYYKKFNKDIKTQVEFSPEVHDMRKKMFTEFERVSGIMDDLLRNIGSLEEEIFSAKQRNSSMRRELELRIEELEENYVSRQERPCGEPGSSYLLPTYSKDKNPFDEDKLEQFSQTTRKRTLVVSSAETRLTRQVEKLKSIIYDKNKEISDLIAAYEKLKLQKETESVLYVSNKLKRSQIQNMDEDQSDAELVHDILDLQIRLNKQKEKKNLIMEELQLRKSLNRSQEVSHNIPHFDLSTVYQQLRAIITSRENYITTEQTLKKLVTKINQMHSNKNSKNDNYKMNFSIEEKSRVLSKQLQKMKSLLLKVNLKELDPIKSKALIANAFRPVQAVVEELIFVTQTMANNDNEQ